MAKDAIDKSSAPPGDVNIAAFPAETPEGVGTPSGDILSMPVSVATVGEEAPQQAGARRQIVKSATLVMLGNLGSSIMGMLRQIVVASLGGAVAGDFISALKPTQTFYDFIVNGSVPGVLIPTFNDYAAPEKREEFRRVVFTVVNIIILIMLVASLLFLVFSPSLIDILAAGFKASDKTLTLHFAQIIFFSLVILGPFSVLLAGLYAVKEFGWPAFATAAYHVGIIVGAVAGSLLSQRYLHLGQYGLAVGVILGALGEIGLLIPGLRNQRIRYMLVIDWRHPALRRILKLYGPVAVSFLASMALVFLDTSLQSQTPGHSHSVAAMGLATTLIQFPVGLVAAALSLAVLPTLSEYARGNDMERFKETLQLGFRLGLLLMIPAAAGLIVLQLPIVTLVFRHGHYTAQDAQLTAIALQNYAYQLPFVAMDQLLIAAFYARKNTLVPVIVGFVSMLCYLGVALPFWRVGGVAVLAFANTVQNSMHAIILLVLLRMTIGSMSVRKTAPTVLKILVATAAMVAVAWVLQKVLGHIALFSLSHLLGALLTVAIAGGLATAVYFGLILLFKVEEISLLQRAVMTKLGKK